ncbi:NEW3 domain-containing protein [Angustibacter luteus]|uniref:NEW3 domain-containing protein n=1 Tax=Angustibacter luteus TaxID=658456 RepID=A0ABW1J9U7_9ACTN
MATKRRTTKAADAPPPILLRGTPRHLDATVSVTNEGDRAVTVRSATVRGPDVRTTTARVGARLAAGSTGTVPVSVSLPASTAPGSYPVELEVAGVARDAVLQVEADLDLRISPSRLLAQRGQQPLSVRITNAGNVSVPIASVLRARLWTNGVVGDLDVEVGLDSPVTVEPGVTVDATGHVSVPDDLDPTRRHQARIPVGTATLVVVVLPSDEKPTTARKSR